MKNIPEKIYLNINTPFNDVEDFNDLEGVTWSKDRTHVDVSYYSLSMLKKAYEAGVDACGQYHMGDGSFEDFNDWFNREVLNEDNYME